MLMGNHVHLSVLQSRRREKIVRQKGGSQRLVHDSHRLDKFVYGFPQQEYPNSNDSIFRPHQVVGNTGL
jgi:hypothetical protein